MWGKACSNVCGHTRVYVHLPVHMSVEVRGQLWESFLGSHLIYLLFIYIFEIIV